mmetsp:Transcript_11081/g.18901  ORF Transcript_11081/g.18901 Transcript_11081/m.18901 type:complete len:149 (-) Transcript_11081:120-566(-)
MANAKYFGPQRLFIHTCRQLSRQRRTTFPPPSAAAAASAPAAAAPHVPGGPEPPPPGEGGGGARRRVPRRRPPRSSGGGGPGSGDQWGQVFVVGRRAPPLVPPLEGRADYDMWRVCFRFHFWNTNVFGDDRKIIHVFGPISNATAKDC